MPSDSESEATKQAVMNQVKCYRCANNRPIDTWKASQEAI